MSALTLEGYFFFNDTATTEIYTLSLHDALPIYPAYPDALDRARGDLPKFDPWLGPAARGRGYFPSRASDSFASRSEEHTSELQSRQYLVCRLLLEKKKKNIHSCPLLNDSRTVLA